MTSCERPDEERTVTMHLQQTRRRLTRLVMVLALGAASAGADAPRPHDSALTITLSPTSVVGGNPVSGTVTLSAAAPAGGVSVTISSSSLSIAGIVSPNLGASSALASVSIKVPEGSSSVAFLVNTVGVPLPTVVTIGASVLTESASTPLTIRPASVKTLAFAPASVTGGASVTGTLALDGATPSGGSLTLALTTTGTGASAPSSVSIGPQKRNGTFTVTTTPTSTPRAVTVSASLGQTASGTLSIVPPTVASLQLGASSVIGGVSVTATLTLSGSAPAGGMTVPLSSANRVATVPRDVVVPEGAQAATFSVTTQPVRSETPVTISAGDVAGQKPAVGILQPIGAPVARTITAELVVQPLTVKSVLFGAPPGARSLGIVGVRSVPGVIVLNGAVPSGQRSLSLRSNSPAVTVPATIVVAAGSDRATFTAVTQEVSVLTEAVVNVTLAAVSEIADGTSNTVLVSETGIETVFRGNLGVITLYPVPQLQSISVAPSQVAGGDPIALTLAIAVTATVPSGGPSVSPPPEPLRAQIVVDRADLVQLPTSVAVPVTHTGVGTSPGPAPIPGKTIAPSTDVDQTVTITVTLEGRSASTAVLLRRPQLAIASLELRPTTVRGGTSTILTIVPSASLAATTVVALSSDRPDILTLPGSITLNPASRLITSLTLNTQVVTAPATVTITATAGTQQVRARLEVTP